MASSEVRAEGVKVDFSAKQEMLTLPRRKTVKSLEDLLGVPFNPGLLSN